MGLGEEHLEGAPLYVRATTTVPTRGKLISGYKVGAWHNWFCVSPKF